LECGDGEEMLVGRKFLEFMQLWQIVADALRLLVVEGL